MHEHSLSRTLVPATLLATATVIIGLTWWWLGQPVAMPQATLPADKLHCVSYAPFRDDQSPSSAATYIPASQIEEDLTRLKPLTDCVRTYSVEHGLDQIPEIARRLGMTVIQGLWLSSNIEKNRQHLDSVVALAKRFPDVIRSIVVGNEVLLRGELSAPDLANIIREVKRQVSVPVTYADVWEFWLRHREIYAAVDFVTVHILPYWEDIPIPARDAAAHVGSIRARMAVAFPDKEILIGETGWPSAGRMREGALPSQINQALVVQEVLALAKRDGYRVNVIEAFDQPWKRQLEGTVGGYWGLLDAQTRSLKFQWGAPVSNHPHWRLQAGGGIAFAILIFGAAAFARQYTFKTFAAPVTLWMAVAAIAAAGGAMIGLAVERMPVESLGAGGWIRSAVLVALAVLTPLAAAGALMRQIFVPSFAALLSRTDGVRMGRLQMALGLLLIVLTVMAVQVALGLVFDPRYKDFPYAPLTACIVPFAVLTLRDLAARGHAMIAERAAAALLALSAVYILFNEGISNWQSVWFCALLIALAAILHLRRPAPAAQS